MMRQSGSIIDVSDIARIGVFSALAFGVNLPFLSIPNIEIFSISLFLSGLFMGVKNGLAVCLVSGLIYIFLNPNGPQTIPAVGIVQIICFTLYGISGGCLRKKIIGVNNVKNSVIIMVLAGFTVTLIYDLSTNLVFALMFGPFWPALIGGISFSVVHLISNTVIFGVCGTVVNKIWKRLEFILPSSRY